MVHTHDNVDKGYDLSSGRYYYTDNVSDADWRGAKYKGTKIGVFNVVVSDRTIYFYRAEVTIEKNLKGHEVRKATAIKIEYKRKK